MLKAIDVANFFVYISELMGEEVTNMKLNKLVYFAQGFYMAKYNKKLFSENIEAWQHGPVVAEVYESFKGCKSNPVPYVFGSFDIENFSTEEADFLSDIALKYCRFTAAYLRNLTHNQAPWFNNFEESKHNVIPADEIKAFFLTQSPIESKTTSESIGYINEEGYTVLPKEWDDDWQ